jgi:hypothetical protein
MASERPSQPRWLVPPSPRIPSELRLLPFRGSEAVRRGLLTRSRLRRGGWRRLLPDVYIAADVDVDFRLWCEAVIVFLGASSRGVAISGRSAARLFDVSIGHPVLPGELPNVTALPVPDEPIEATVPPGRFLPGAPRSAIKIVRARLTPSDITLVNTLPVTAPARTAFDLARQLGRDEAVAAIDSMLNKRMLTLVDARAYLLASPSVAGRPRVAGVFNGADAGAQSPMETYLRLFLVDHGFPRPVVQLAVRDERGQLLGYVDLGYREQRVGIEYEGDYHRDRVTFRRDIARVNAMQEAGWVIVRVTASDLRDPARLLRQLRSLLAARSPRSARRAG